MSDAPLETPSRPAFSMSVPVLLVLLSIAGLVPLIGFSLYSLGQSAASARDSNRELVAARGQSLSANVDREINGLASTGAALAVSPSLAAGDFGRFHAEAKLAMLYARANVLLLDLSLQQLVNTRVPFGTVLPVSTAPPETLDVIKTKTLYISDIFMGKVAKQLVFNVTLPVIINGEVAYVLVVSAEPSRLDEVLRQQALPDGWAAVISDRTGAVFSSNLAALPFACFDMEPAATGIAPDVAILGQPSILSRKTSTLTGWTTTVWVADAVLEAPLAATWRHLAAASLLAISLSALLAYFFSLPFANLIRQTLRAAAAIGGSGEIPPITTFLAEGSVIQSRLAAADQQLRLRHREAEEGKALLDTLLENIPEGITIVGGPDMRVIANSRKALEWIGRPEAELEVQAGDHAEAFGIWFPDGMTRPAMEQLPLYRASRLGETTSEEYFAVKRPDGTQITIEASVTPVRDPEGRVIGAVSCWRDVTFRILADRLIADNERRLTLALHVAGMAIIDINLQKGVVAGLANSKTVLGMEIGADEVIEAALAKILQATHADDQQRVEANLRAAMAAPGPFSDEFRVIRPDGSIVWIDFRGETIADAHKRPIRLLGTNFDITARKRAEEHLRLVSRELTHRAKNLLAVILAIATQTARRNTDVEDFLAAFSRRIHGLSASHDLLVKTDWSGVPLDDLFRAQLASFGGVDGHRIAMSGPAVVLKPEVLQSLGLAMHELATNAVKYGALSTANGSVAIVWSVDRAGTEPRFRMSWTESGGPKVKKPTRRGFGQVIIESSLAQTLNGDVKIAYAPKGVVWTVDAPLAAVTPA